MRTYYVLNDDDTVSYTCSTLADALRYCDLKGRAMLIVTDVTI